MQRDRSSLDSFPEPIDLNQGSIPNNTSPMDISSSWDISPIENRLSNYMLSPSDGNDDRCHDFTSWDRGESSSSANNTRGGDDSKTNLGWSSSIFTPCSGSGLDSENWSFKPQSNSGSTSEILSMQNRCEAVNLNSNGGHTRENMNIPTFYASSSNIGGFTDSSSGSSCKRKALEGTSNQNINHHHQHSHIPGYVSRGNLSISSSGPMSPSYSEHMNPSNSGPTMNMQPPCFFPSSSNLPETSARNMTFSFRSNNGRNDPSPFNTSSSSSFSRNSDVYSSPIPITTYPNAALNQSPHPVNEASGITHPYPWNGSSFDSRTLHAHEETVATNARTSYPNRDQIDWSFVPGNSNTSSSRSPSFFIPRVGPESSSSTWVPSRNHQRLLESGSPWVPTEYGNRRSHFVAHFPSSSSEVGSSSRSQHRSTDAPGEGINRWRSLAAVEGRHRLIRQVLTAMRRGGQLQPEEYMLVDPFFSGFAEFQDRHRDMRLDVDNMSYEELLALEDSIGNVSTGLSNEQITSSMKQRRFDSIRVSPNMEPCCVCQENYINGDDIGILDCGHEFHTDCIKQWLTQKNICPICKTTGLEI